VIRFVTFNVRHGLAEGADEPDPHAVAAVVGALGADVLALQELDVRVPRSGSTDQLQLALDAAPGRTGHFAKTLDMHGGDYGIGLVVRGRLDDLAEYSLQPPGELRKAIIARVHLDDSDDRPAPPPFTVAATHLQNDRKVARAQLVELLGVLAERPGPHVLLGDLNISPFTVDGVCMELAWDAVANAATFPARSPRTQIDWVVTRGFDLVAAVVPDVRVSDHRPVVVELTPRPD
jgi:endonuclease/exonuclease/phosphatase family metal-dependent hydrolase